MKQLIWLKICRKLTNDLLMTLSSLKRLFLLFCIAVLGFACERDEPVPEKALFTLDIRDNFFRFNYMSVVIISNTSGDVLITRPITSVGELALKVPKQNDNIYNLTFYGGLQTFTTYAHIPSGKYVLDEDVPSNYSPVVGTHSIFFTPSYIELSGSSARLVARNNDQLTLDMRKETSDAYIFYDSGPAGHSGYVYLPTISVNESTTLTTEANGRKFNTVRVMIENTTGTRVTLEGGNEPHANEMQYLLSRNFLRSGGDDLRVPAKGEPPLTYYRTTFLTNDGHYYSVTGAEIATTQKQLNTNVQLIRTTPASIEYSIESNATLIDWTGESAGFTWRVLSPAGTSMKINLPKLSREFKDQYSIPSMETLKFSSASVISDSRFGSYTETIKFKYLEQRPGATGKSSYEVIQHPMPVD